MDTNVGAIVGTVFVVLFGGVIAFYVPRLIAREDDEHGAGDLPVGKWLRILGLVVMIVGLIQVVLMFVL